MSIVEENRKKLAEELKDPVYAPLSDEEVVEYMKSHGVIEKLGFFVFRSEPLVVDGVPVLDDLGNQVMVTRRYPDVVRPDHIARFRPVHP